MHLAKGYAATRLASGEAPGDLLAWPCLRQPGTFDPTGESNRPCLAIRPDAIVESMKRISRSVEDKTLPHAHGRYCDQEIVEAPDIGWLDPTPGDTYDLCPGSRYGDHEPSDARGDTSRSRGPLL